MLTNKTNFSDIAARWSTLVVMLLLTSAGISCSQNTVNDAEWLVEVLELKEGSVVAEIGAGDGSLTLAMARHVGSTGQVFSSELSADSVSFLQNVVDESQLTNITVVDGHPTQTNFPKACCNALFMRRVYHHFDDPASMNESIWQSLKPGGRAAIIDFEPRGSASENPEDRDTPTHHGVTAEAVVEELRAAGFTLVSKDQRLGGDIYVVMEKPEQ